MNPFVMMISDIDDREQYYVAVNIDATDVEQRNKLRKALDELFDMEMYEDEDEDVHEEDAWTLPWIMRHVSEKTGFNIEEYQIPTWDKGGYGGDL